MPEPPTPPFVPETVPASQPHWLTRCLWWCSGSAPELLRQLPTERAKYAGIGGAVLSTWCLATCAGGYALYTMADGAEWRLTMSVVGGLIWGLVIFNIDRFLVSSVRKSSDRSAGAVLKAELVPALPRLAFAVAIALTIAEPLEMRLFAPEIEDRVEANRDRLVAERQTSLRGVAETQSAIWRGEVAQIDADLAASRARLETLRREYIEESDGRGGSQRVGAGPLTEIKRAEMARAAADHQALTDRLGPRRDELQQRLDTTELGIRDQLAAYRASLGSGYLARREALTQLAAERAGVAGAIWAIFILMVMVEITPILLKVLSPFGPYDGRLALVEAAALTEAGLERDHRVAVARYHYDLATQAERAVEDASHESNVAVRTATVRRAWTAFGESFPARAYRSVGELVRDFRDALSMHR